MIATPSHTNADRQLHRGTSHHPFLADARIGLQAVAIAVAIAVAVDTAAAAAAAAAGQHI